MKVVIPEKIGRNYDYRDGVRCVFGELEHQLIKPLESYQLNESRQKIVDFFYFHGDDRMELAKLQYRNDQAESHEEQVEIMKEVCDFIGVPYE